MNLAILIGHFPPGSFGGAELQAEGWAQRLSAAHRVTVVTRRDTASQCERETRDGFDIVRLRVSRVPVWRTLAARYAGPRGGTIDVFHAFAEDTVGGRKTVTSGLAAGLAVGI